MTARSAWTAPARMRWLGWSASRTTIGVAFANDPDSDRHGIVTPAAGLMNPNHYLVGGDSLSADASARLAGASRGRQDAGQQQHDRPRRAQAGPADVRGAGWFQMVRAGAVRRLVLLWRRGERRSELPAARRQRVDDRQGWPDHGPAGRRDHSPHRQGPGRALSRADGGVRHRHTTRASMRRRHRRRRRRSKDCRRKRSRHRTWPASRLSRSLRVHQGTTRRSAG